MTLQNAGERADHADVAVCKCPHVNLVLVDGDGMPIAYLAMTPEQASALAMKISDCALSAQNAKVERLIGSIAGRA